VQTLTVSDSTPGAVYHCATGGSTPTAASGSCPSTISASTTVEVYVSASGYTDSAISTAVFTINLQAAAPTISPNGGSFGSTQTLTVSDSTSGATYHCTTDGSTPTSASGSCPATVNLSSTLTTITVKVYASASGYTDSAITSATFNYVAQSVAWTNSSINVDLNGTLAITSSNLTASASCSPASVAFTVVPVSSDTAHATGSTFASYAADTTNATYGSILGGNALLEDNTNTFNATATCGALVSKVTLTVNDVAPTLVSISPTTVKTSSTSTTFDLVGTGFSAQSSTQNLSQWFGTTATLRNGACPTNHTDTGAGTAWISSTHIEQFASGNIGVGTWSYVVYNAPTAAGTGGGWNCLASAFTVTANAITGTGNAMVIVDPGTNSSTAAGASSSTTSTATSTTGTATVIKNGAVTATTTQLALGAGSGNPVAQGNLVFVPNQAAHTISQIDTGAATPTVSTISTGAEYAPVIMAADANNVLVAANANGDPSQGAILTLKNGYLTKLADAPYFDDLAIQAANAVWVSTPKGSTTAQVHMIALTGGPETVAQLTQHADSLKVMADGTLLAFHVGDATALVLDPFTLAERGSVSFAKGLYGFSGDYATLSDGSIGKVAVSQDGSGNPTASFTAIDTAAGNYGSFAVDTTTQPGVAKVYSVYHDGSGTSAPRVDIVPLYGGRN